MKSRAIVINPKDNVANALVDIEKGEVVEIFTSRTLSVKVKSDIPFGHKFAVRDIPKGGEIIKYGEVIGRATKDIREGEHVHVHNVESLRARGDIITPG